MVESSRCESMLQLWEEWRFLRFILRCLCDLEEGMSKVSWVWAIRSVAGSFWKSLPTAPTKKDVFKVDPTVVDSVVILLNLQSFLV